MQTYIYVLIYVLTGAALLWFGYNFFVKIWTEFHLNRIDQPWLYKIAELPEPASPGDPRVCPICSARLNKGDLVQTLAYPSLSGGKDRLMHIRGCVYCLAGEYERKCPVCGASLANNEILVARMFERSSRRSHVHILGCNWCRMV